MFFMQQVTKKKRQNSKCNEHDVQQTVTKFLSPPDTLRHMAYFAEIKQHSFNVQVNSLAKKRKHIFATMNHIESLLHFKIAFSCHVRTKPIHRTLSNFYSFRKQFGCVSSVSKALLQICSSVWHAREKASKSFRMNDWSMCPLKLDST